MADERLKVAVFIDFDNIQIGVKETLNKEFDVSLVLEALKERGEVVAKIAYGDWAKAGEYSRQMTQHAIQMVQRSVTPRGDKNGADINLALDALEMAFTRHHINSFAIVGGDSDFMALVEKLKQFDKQVFVIGGRAFTSNILQRNCTEFIAYENLLKPEGRGSRSSRREGSARAGMEIHPLSEALPNIRRALKILADRGVAAQLGLLKSTLLQLDSTFTERDFGAGSFLEFMQKVQESGLARLKRIDRGYLVEPLEAEGATAETAPGEAEAPTPAAELTPVPPGEAPAKPPESAEPKASSAEALNLLRRALASASAKAPNRPLYMRQIRQALKAIDPGFDEHSYGLRGTLDLLHHAQREGWVRLQRDHKGVWRIFCLNIPGEPSALGAEVVVEAPFPSEGAAPVEIEESIEIQQAQEPAFELPRAAESEAKLEAEEAGKEEAGEFVLVAPGVVEAASGEPDAKPKRKRASHSGSKPPRRPTRRKAKEPAAE